MSKDKRKTEILEEIETLNDHMYAMECAYDNLFSDASLMNMYNYKADRIKDLSKELDEIEKSS